jgi:hypothetical protein
VGFTIGSSGKVPGKPVKREDEDGDDNNNSVQFIYYHA